MVLLGSLSTTRAKILDSFGVLYIQRPSDFDEESVPFNDAASFVKAATEGKLASCERLYGVELPLLCADTVVVVGDRLLQKPLNTADAERSLRLQSGAKVDIVTCTIFKSRTDYLEDISTTSYFFAPFEEAELQSYLESGEWDGKAGGCMVEGFCKKYIEKVEGLESTAMGLTIEKILPLLNHLAS